MNSTVRKIGDLLVQYHPIYKDEWPTWKKRKRTIKSNFVIYPSDCTKYLRIYEETGITTVSKWHILRSNINEVEEELLFLYTTGQLETTHDFKYSPWSSK